MPRVELEAVAIHNLRNTLEAAPPPTLPDALRLLRDIRVLLEAASRLGQYPVLRFFCDWALHAEITDSDVVQRKLIRVNDFFLAIMAHPTPYQSEGDPIANLEQALEVGKLRAEMAQLMAHYSLPAPFLHSFLGWQHMLAAIYGELVMKPLRLPDPQAALGGRKPRGTATRARRRLEERWLELKGHAENLVDELRLEFLPPAESPMSEHGTLHWTAVMSRHSTGKGAIEVTVEVTPLEPESAFAEP